MILIPFKIDYLSTDLSSREIFNLLNQYIENTKKEKSRYRDYVVLIKDNKVKLKVISYPIASLRDSLIKIQMILKLSQGSEKTKIKLITRFSFIAYFLLVFIYLFLGFISVTGVLGFLESNPLDFEPLLSVVLFLYIYFASVFSMYKYSNYVIDDFSQLFKWIKI